MSQENEFKWTVMIYLAGNNSLSEECVYALTDMSISTKSDKMAVVAQLNTGVHDSTTIRIEKGMTPEEIHDKLKKALTNSNGHTSGMGSTRNRIFNFVKYCKDSFPADHYMLVLSGHGSGTMGDFLNEDRRGKGFSIIDLGGLIEDIKKQVFLGKNLDILGLDTCLMSMTEIAYLIHNHVDVMIGAEGFEPMAGWPYARVLKKVNELHGDPKLLAKKIVCEYIDHYRVYQAANLSVDQSACDLNQAVDLMKAINSLATVLKGRLERYEENRAGSNAPVRDAVILAHWEAQLYKNEQYTDLYDFCTLLKERLAGKELAGKEYDDVRKVCQNVLNVIRGADKEADAHLADDSYSAPYSDRKMKDRERWMHAVNFQEAPGFVLKSCYSGWTVQYSYGVSIYFPWSKVPGELEDYKRLYFARDSSWAAFLEVYLRVTQRQPRPGAEEPMQFRDQFLRPLFNITDSPVGLPFRDAWSTRDAWATRGLRNLIGSMKNAPTAFSEGECDTD